MLVRQVQRTDVIDSFPDASALSGCCIVERLNEQLQTEAVPTSYRHPFTGR